MTVEMKIPQTIQIDNHLSLVLIDNAHASALLAAIDRNRDWLRKWLPWVDYMRTTQHVHSYIDRCREQHLAGTDIGFVIFYDEQLIGRIGIHNVDQRNRIGAIGYWIDHAYAGKGIVTKACKEMLQLGFENLQLHRMEIRCATGNDKSAAVAERLGFLKEGVLREAELVN
ncbi:MAG: GNAT family N-acetyltransferase, partial [Chitinophagaceae bacterium]